jgi:hypothetical protein
MILSKGSSRQYLQDYRNGKIKKGLGLGCDLDTYLRFKPRQYNGVLGSDNVGKTYFMTWYMLALSSQHGLKWCVWMDENSKGQAMRDLIQMYSGINYMDLALSEIEMYSYKIEEWFTFVDNEPSYKPSDLLNLFASTEADGFFIDPFNQLDHDMNYESNIKFIRSLKRWCKIKNKTVYLSMHPVTASGRKISEYPKEHDWAGHPMIPNKSMAEGGKLFANMSDDWINVHRLTKHTTMKWFTMIDIDKVKDKDTGGAQSEMNTPTLLEYNFGLGFKVNGVDPIKRQHKTQTKIEPLKNFSEPQTINNGVEFEDNHPKTSYVKPNDSPF